MKKIFVTAATCAVLALASRPSHAGCGFYTAPVTASASAAALVNDADQVAIMREGTRVALTMSTNYKGPAEDFAMIVPVPVVLAKENVKTLSPEIFTHLEKLTAPRVVEYDEADPCPRPAMASATAIQPKGGAPGGAPPSSGGGGGGLGVTVLAQFITGEYEIVVLSAKESDGLETWLKQNAYKVPDGAAAALAPYVAQQQKFVVAKVDSKKVHRDAAGAVVLSPLRFVYETNDFRLPVRLGLLNAPEGKKQDVIVYLIAKNTRLEAANLSNVVIPTNVDVDEKVIPSFGAFYASLLDATMASAKSKGAVAVTEYAWAAQGCGSPCDVTPLSLDEFSKLGTDELFPASVLGESNALVLTRLHTRYDKDTLQDDIVFRDAPPLAGGTEGRPGAEAAPLATKVNELQARYTVRHPWQGPIECDEPLRGVWVPSEHAGTLATDFASAPRDVSLASMVQSPIPALGLALSSPPFAAKPSLAAAKGSKTAKSDSTGARTAPTTTWIYAAAGALVIGACAWLILRKR